MPRLVIKFKIYYVVEKEHYNTEEIPQAIKNIQDTIRKD
jgi:translation elongation factor EF-1beta